MNELKEISIDHDDPSEEVLHVFLNDGSKFAVSATAFQHQASPEDLILFLKPDGVPDERIFLRARSVECIIPESSLRKSRSFTELRDRVDNIEARMALLENAAAQQIKDAD
jgi:hypothetical protein